MSQFLDPITIFSNQLLTGSFVVATTPYNVIPITTVDEVVLDVTYTTGTAETANTLDIKVEFANPLGVANAPVTADWVQETMMNPSGGVTLIDPNIYRLPETASVAATSYPLQIPIPVESKYMRISVRESGVAANFGRVTMKITPRERNNRN